MGRNSSPRDDNFAPHHARTFDTFSSAINLTNQAAPTPGHAASALRVCNTNDTPASSAPATVTAVMSDGTSVAFVVPANTVETIRGSFKEITSVTGGNNAADVTITAFWHDFG